MEEYRNYFVIFLLPLLTTRNRTGGNLLKNLLEQHDSYPANEIFIQGKKLGISKRTIENVKQELGIKSVRVGTGWHWSMK